MGKNGGRPKKAKESEDNPKEPNGFFKNQSEPKKADSDNDSDSEPDNDSDNENEHDNDIEKENKEKVEAFMKGFGNYDS